MARIYTRTGDKGTTALIGGERVSKTDSRVEAYGTVDELGAHIALLADFATEVGLSQMVEILDRVAVDLMKVGAEDVELLEKTIDRFSEDLPPFRGFTIPGGHRVVSQCHICRTVCRRAERRILTAMELHPVEECVVGYINRLSDLLYTLSSWSAKELGVEEKLWGK